jgi:elongation factor P
MIIASDLKQGMAIRIDGQIYQVLAVEARAGAAKLSGVVRTKLRNVASGRGWEPHFRPDERLENLVLDRRLMEFLFSDSDTSTFMSPETFDQIAVPREMLGDAVQFLEPGMVVPVEFFEGHPISLVLPDIMEARIGATAPATHSQQDSTWKDAVLENGLHIRVPLFIAQGESVRVDVRTGRYVERVRQRKHVA